MPDQCALLYGRLVLREGRSKWNAEEVCESGQVKASNSAGANLFESVSLNGDTERGGTLRPASTVLFPNSLQVYLGDAIVHGYLGAKGMNPTVLEYRQENLDTQEHRPAESWKERIQWIVDTYEKGDTQSERIGNAAETLGLSSEAVRQYYVGRYKPGGDTLAAIVEKYPRVNPQWLLTGTGPRERPMGVDPRAETVKDIRSRFESLLDEIAGEYGIGTGPDEAPGPDTEPSTSAASDREFAREMGRASEAVSRAKRGRSSRRRA